MALFHKSTVRKLLADLELRASQEGFNKIVFMNESGSLFKCPPVQKNPDGSLSVVRQTLGINLFVARHKKVLKLYRYHRSLWQEIITQNLLHEVGHLKGFDLASIYQSQLRRGIDPTSEHAIDWQESQANLYVVARMGLKAAALATWFQWIYPHADYRKYHGDIEWLRRNTQEYLVANYKWLKLSLFDSVFKLVVEINSQIS